ncbi:MAG: GxxExxY protein [Cyclobacteriaceae bacterium]|nr:GxxExxY protein [Cyclobacteriaceae bacterium]
MMVMDNLVSGLVIRAAIDVHRALGPGLLESAYSRCLAIELRNRGIFFEQERNLPITYHGVTIESGYRIDFLVDRRVVVEVKAVEKLGDIHTAQVLTYMKLMKCRVGLLLNFNVPLLKDGIQRLVI